MALYNMTQLQQATTVSGLFQYANDATGGIMIGLFMIAVFFVMLMMFLKHGFISALLASSFICFLLSGILAYGGLMKIVFPILFLLLAGGTSLMSLMKRGGN